MDTAVLRTLSFVSRTIRGRRTHTAISTTQQSERPLIPAPVVSTHGIPLDAGVRATPQAFAASDAGAVTAGCSAAANRPLFQWQDTPPSPASTGRARSWPEIVPHLIWEQVALILSSAGSDIRRV
jgi:hypothetical protein